MKTILIFTLLALSAAAREPSYAEKDAGSFSLTIAAGASVSGSINISGWTLTALTVPIITAANLTFQVSADDSTWYDLYDEYGLEVTIVTGSGAAARAIRLTPSEWWGMKYIRIRSGTTGAPVTQAGTRVIAVAFR